MENEGRVAVYIDFDNIVISRYNQLYGRGAFQSDRVRDFNPTTHTATGRARGRSGRSAADDTASSSDASVRTEPNASVSADRKLLERLTEATVDIGAVLDYASSFGRIVVSRAYADWSQPVNAGYRRQLVDRAIDLTQMFPLSATKNGADIRLAIDVVEDLFRLADVTHVVLVAGDSDYVALAQRVKRLGRTIIAVGVAGATSRALPAACNDFSLYDDLPGFSGSDADSGELDGEVDAAEGNSAGAGAADVAIADAAVASESDAPTADAAASDPATDGDAAPTTRAGGRKSRKRKAGEPTGDQSADAGAAGEGDVDDDAQATKMSARAATTLLRRALALGHDKNDDEWLHTSAVKQQIKRLDPSFHEKSIGYGSFTDFVKSRSRIAELEKDSNGQRVRLRSRRTAHES
ncbi:hypothetical protein GCM10011490_01520 [Pseudoclavibacter endophyticus]|uniref:NYN domain-containing protein n=1 Tax=Pseudoclavibacter endophyticus TaxID=1778590 RepID=A0A6H9WUP2_9MICO|nr:NYN domain-containing protein [Pseudoclavibacter endophyticus]KAB1650587.1 NYN domain-containing protein [Pseudoclavibacter endophyticus]GGA55341.1 hypothetical protein GCM10011490_01520 [Pseudoclavibacter endophyticus]